MLFSLAIANQVKLGDIGVAAATMVKAGSSPQILDADIYTTPSRSRLCGMSVEGAVINRRDDWNLAIINSDPAPAPTTTAAANIEYRFDDGARRQVCCQVLAMRRNSRTTGNDPYATRTTGKAQPRPHRKHKIPIHRIQMQR